MFRGVIPSLLVLSVFSGCTGDAAAGSCVKKVFGATGLGPGEFSYPRALAISPVDGCVFVVDKTARVQRFSSEGQYQAQWRMPESTNGKPTGVYVDASGLVWVADTHYARVIVFDRDGREQFRFGSRGDGPGQFIFPTNVVIDHQGYIFVGEYGENSRISKFAPDRKFLMSFGGKDSGDAWVERPQALALDENENLWVADACRHRVCKYARDGRLLSVFGHVGSDLDAFNFPYGLALEKGGSLLIADRCNNRLVRYDRSGRAIGTWGTPGRAAGQLQQPWAVAVGKDGRIYCLDSWNNRVQVLDW